MNSKTLDLIIGQKNAINFIKKTLKSNHLSHAYLFEGPDGIGKSTVANIFASIILCENPSEIQPCGNCKNCFLNNAGSNPDIFVIQTDSNTIGIDEVRKLQDHVVLRPMYSKKKVYLIFDAEKLTVQAQNCLLKTLEEPPEYAVIIMTSQNPDSLLKTVKSRTERIKFNKLSPDEIKIVLAENKEISKVYNQINNLDFVVSFSDGIPKKALDLVKSDAFSTLRDKSIEHISALLNKTADFFDVSSFFESNKETIDTILEIFTLFLRDLLLSKVKVNNNLLLNSDKKNIIINLAQNKSLKENKILELIDYIENIKSNLKHNVNYQLSVDTLIIKLQEA